MLAKMLTNNRSIKILDLSFNSMGKGINSSVPTHDPTQKQTARKN